MTAQQKFCDIHPGTTYSDLPGAGCPVCAVKALELFLRVYDEDIRRDERAMVIESAWVKRAKAGRLPAPTIVPVR